MSQLAEQEPQTTKRLGGLRTKDGDFIVLQESIKERDGKGYFWRHNCGREVLGAHVVCSCRDPRFTEAGDGSVVTVSVPFCPNCERQPLGGTYTGRDFSIDQWGK